MGITTPSADLRDCGTHRNDTCPPLSVIESRSHFGAWCIVSGPLILGFNFSDAATVDKHWATVTNLDAIDVNQVSRPRSRNSTTAV